LALQYARRGAPHGSLFVAREQTSGRGRFGRRWESDRGGLYLSVILEPESQDPLSLLPHLTAVAAAEALIAITGLDVGIRWPNDLYSSGLKLGGILCEGSFRGSVPEHFVAGIGINVNQRLDSLPAAVRARAIGLAEHRLDERDIAARIVSRLESWWRTRDANVIVTRFRELADGAAGRRVRVQPRLGESFEATTRGIAADGGLAIQLDDGTERILYSEDVVHLLDTGDG
jgi:BirA family biotin operon repressor/biotin-[acetyl-CoA-carboxylase] ligase